MNMNYNPWFYKYYRYLKGKRNGVESYNSTRYIDAFERYSKVESLLQDQPYGIVSTTKGFERLIDLLTKSNYTFEDINDSLIKTYKENLQNAMGRMTVNTHASIVHYTDKDKNVSTDTGNSDYRIIDVPFDQLHHGNRDEFIRQMIEKMHHWGDNRYVHMSEFISPEVQRLLSFSIMITTNGRICNDWYVAINDHGFLFKVNWTWSETVDFNIYMLDDCRTVKVLTSLEDIDKKRKIPSTNFRENFAGNRCIVDIYDENYYKTTRSIPAFGKFNSNNELELNLQDSMIKELNGINASAIQCVVYIFKFLHEIPSLYPAINYYDLMESHAVYDKQDKRVYTDEEKLVVSGSDEINRLEVCTPPIILDRPVNISFDIISRCLSMKEEMLKYNDDILMIGRILTQPVISQDDFLKMKGTLSTMFINMYLYYIAYTKGAMLTSLIPSNDITIFKNFINHLIALNMSTIDDCQNYTFDELYDNNFVDMVYTLDKPFEVDALQPFTIMGTISNHFFDEDTENYKCYNRPISEDLIISLKYNREEEAWLFTYPYIKHFNGIGNSFYINEKLKGNEIFKFFILYSDTDNPSEEDKQVEPFSEDLIFDFDKFEQEVEKHLGYIRYWHNENKIMKISEILFSKYDEERAIQVLSKILKRKVDGEDILNETPSDILYDTAGISTVTTDYDENSDVAPFVVNYLFYTVSMMETHKDQLQQYFFRHLVNDEFINSYADIDIKEEILKDKHTCKVNLSDIHIAPTTIDTNESYLPVSSSLTLVNGMPMIVQGTNNILQTPYNYVFNEYENERNYNILGEFADTYFVRYADVTEHGYDIVSYKNDIKVANLFTHYMTYMVDALNALLNFRDRTYRTRKELRDCILKHNKILDQIREYDHASFVSENIQDAIYDLINDNDVNATLNEISNQCVIIDKIVYNGKTTSMMEFVNKELLGTLKYVYKNNGFKSEIYPRVRKFYKHLKKFNKKLNLYELKEWTRTLDWRLLDVLDDYISYNPDVTIDPNTFSKYYGQTYTWYSMTLNGNIPHIESLIDDFINTIYPDQYNMLAEIVMDVKDNCIFDLYTIKDIEFNSSTQYVTKPAVAKMTIQRDSHFSLPDDATDNISFVFSVTTDRQGSKYIIESINKVCEYVAFDDTPLNCTLTLLTTENVQVGTLSATITFSRVGSTADMLSSFEQISYDERTILSFENNHDTYEIINDKIVNDVFSNMNYELMVLNKFKPLHHDTEVILHADTFMPGAIDRIQIPNSVINNFVNETNTSPGYRMFFKAGCVIPSDSGVAYGGKFYKGQRIYLRTEDGFIFPANVTVVDHSQAHGFIEAEVDHVDAKWFEIKDNTLIEKYLTEPIPCTIIDDNISNFMDEYTNSNYVSYDIVSLQNNTQYPDDGDFYELPGDPLYVTNNADYIYQRLVKEFNVPDKYNLCTIKYIDRIGYIYIQGEDNHLKVNLINHDFNTVKDSQMYPILREEPNDHDIWAREVGVFEAAIDSSKVAQSNLETMLARYQEELKHETDGSKRLTLTFKIDSTQRSIKYEEECQKRFEIYIKQLETPTTWFNVYDKDSCMVYLDNGRAVSRYPYITNIRDIQLSDKTTVLLYDENKKEWLDPVNDYSVSFNVVNNTKFDERSDYQTDSVLYSLDITMNTTESYQSLLVYIAYDQSDVFDDIEIPDDPCYALFKPIMSLNKPVEDYDPYRLINLRKHMNGKEVYKFDTLEEIDGFSLPGLHVERVDTNGKYNSPPLRVCDVEIIHNGNTFDYTNIELWVKQPFKDVTSTAGFKTYSYNAIINQPIEYVDEDDDPVVVNLICVNASHFNGNISDLMFEGILSVESGTQSLQIINATTQVDAGASFVCTVVNSDEYRPIGGVISVSCNSSSTEVIDEEHNWIKIPDTLSTYRIIPKECIITLKDTILVDDTKPIFVSLKSEYSKDYNDTILDDNSSVFNPYEYYYDTKKNVRYPIADIRANDIQKRLVIPHENTDVKMVKSTYIGVCRYLMQRLPKSGIVDVTGYIPTPLSRERYQFWVNGADLTQSDNLHIISPTSIQFTNLTSLRNFELIELVYDTDSSIVNRKHIMYMDLDGNMHSSVEACMLTNTPIITQSIKFTFNLNTHTKLHNITSAIINNPNNNDFDEDILDNLSQETPTSYKQIYNIPTINGQPLTHLTLNSLGLNEVDPKYLLKMLDKVWKNEIINDPHFYKTHRYNILTSEEEKITLHVKRNVNFTSDEDYYIAYVTSLTEKCFTMYISKNENDMITNTSSVQRIMTMIRTGVPVYIDKSFHGLWLHTNLTSAVLIQ